MNYTLLITCLIICLPMKTQQIVIFDKENKCFMDSSEKSFIPKEKDKIDFLNAFKNDLSKGDNQRIELKLENPPLEWGKIISDSTYGLLKFYESFANGFITDLWLHHLSPNHNYILTINGNPKLAGNNLLPDPVPGNPIEKYLDFIIIKTDNKGEYYANLGIFLKKGNYHVRFYVKDTDDFKIILYHDYFKFKVL